MKWVFVSMVLFIVVGALCTAALYLQTVAKVVGLGR